MICAERFCKRIDHTFFPGDRVDFTNGHDMEVWVACVPVRIGGVPYITGHVDSQGSVRHCHSGLTDIGPVFRRDTFAP